MNSQTPRQDLAPWPAPAPAPEDLLARAHTHADRYVSSLGRRCLTPSDDAPALRQKLAAALTDAGEPAGEVLDSMAAAVEGGLLASSSGRFFGWVIGGVLPVALAADWMTAAWDQNAASFATSPAASVAEEVCGTWLKKLLGLPEGASFAFVTGCQMAHATALAAARHRLLATRGVDVERDGLAGAPRLRVLTGPHRHESLLRAARLLGFGSAAVQVLPSGPDGCVSLEGLARALAAQDLPTIVVLQAGDMNTGAFDAFAPACALAHAAGAWVHVDGAFGLWAAASPRFAHLMAGAASADSWATDGHKWLNQGFDSGYVFVADPAAHRAAFALETSFSHAVAGTRRQIDWNPEWSRRARVFATYASLRTLGRSGVAALVERCCALTAQLVTGLAALPGVSVLAPPIINQALVAFQVNGLSDDEATDRVVALIQADGEVWFGTTTWQARRAMRVSVCNWSTCENDVRRAVAAVSGALSELGESRKGRKESK